VHTQGHALHHHCLVDLDHAGIFTGDTFGLSYRELDTAQGAFIVATTTPTQFDPDQLVASVDRLLAFAPRALYLMHYSRVTDVPRPGAELKADIGWWTSPAPTLVRLMPRRAWLPTFGLPGWRGRGATVAPCPTRRSSSCWTSTHRGWSPGLGAPAADPKRRLRT
jgi:glyoxylase-like metal-dependent hydrolase (beta-lactamase superfamily II)